MANYVLSTAFCGRVLLTYARAAVDGLREKAAEAAGLIAMRNAARNTRERRRRAVYKGLKSLCQRRLRDIGLV